MSMEEEVAVCDLYDKIFERTMKQEDELVDWIAC